MSTPGREDAHPRISLDALSDWNAVASSCKRSARQIAEAQAKEDGLGKEERELLLKHMDKVRFSEPQVARLAMASCFDASFGTFSRRVVSEDSKAKRSSSTKH